MATVVGPGRRGSILDIAWTNLRALDKKPGKKATEEAPELGYPKEAEALRSEPYRRLVAAMPCCWCQVERHTQAAHPHPTAKGEKEDDRECIPMCTDRTVRRKPVKGCHARYDQHELMTPAKARSWHAKQVLIVQAAIIDAGEWPKRLPLPAWAVRKIGRTPSKGRA